MRAPFAEQVRQTGFAACALITASILAVLTVRPFASPQAAMLCFSVLVFNAPFLYGSRNTASHKLPASSWFSAMRS